MRTLLACSCTARRRAKYIAKKGGGRRFKLINGTNFTLPSRLRAQNTTKWTLTQLWGRREGREGEREGERERERELCVVVTKICENMD